MHGGVRMGKRRTSFPAADSPLGINLSSIILGGFMLIVFGCIIYAVVQQMWPSVFILISMEAILVLITACAGAVDFFLQEACVGIGNFMRS